MRRVYLDQNQWSYLSHALHGAPRSDEEGAAATAVVDSVTAGEASYPLSTAHVFETWKQHRAEKRLPLAETMMSVSRGDAIAPPQRLLPPELDAALHQRFGRPENPLRVEPFGRGLAHLSGGLAPELDSELAETLRRDNPEMAEREMIDGVDALLFAGPAVDLPVAGIEQPPLQFAEEFAASQLELQEKFKEHGTGKDERRRTVAAGILLDIKEPLHEALTQSGVTLDELTGLGRDGLTSFMLDLPSRVALLELMSRQHGDLGTKWVGNDLNDLVYLSAAIGYCDIVVTERRWSAMLNASDVPARTGTVVLAKLVDLPAELV
jgi:hypothetical protein